MLIKCPECGHEVSDKAPTCANCGIEIAGKYGPKIVPEVEDTKADAPKPEDEEPKKNSHIGVYIISFLFALLVCGGGYLYYNSSKVDDEQAAYEAALQSDDPEVLEGYLADYASAPQSHITAIQERIDEINLENREWQDAVVSNSRSALQRYIAEHPDSKYKKDAVHLIDSIDWASAVSANTPEALKSYIEMNPDGEHVEEANAMIKDKNLSTLQPEEKEAINGLFRSFFQGLNSKDEAKVLDAVISPLTSFLGKSDARESDVLTFMDKLWKNDVKNLNWHIDDDYEITKKEIGNGEYEFSVSFSAKQVTEKEDGTKEARYRIRAKVSPEIKISEFNMSKLVE